jgi:hypothetical protein
VRQAPEELPPEILIILWAIGLVLLMWILASV